VVGRRLKLALLPDLILSKFKSWARAGIMAMATFGEAVAYRAL
jgi:hypothetical protein